MPLGIASSSRQVVGPHLNTSEICVPCGLLCASAGATEVFRLGVEARCPDMPSVINGWAMLAIKQREYDKARELLRKGLSENKLGKNVGFLYHTLGMLELKLGRTEEAWAVFDEATRKYPRHSQLLVGGGLAAEKRGQIEPARELFRRGVECDRLHHQAWQAWAVMEHRQVRARILGDEGVGGFGCLDGRAAGYRA